MKILIVGNGGREHAIGHAVSKSSRVSKIYFTGENAGLETLGESCKIASNEIDRLLEFAKENQIDLTIVGPEDPLVNGISDRFEAEGLKIFGPNRKSSQLEGSKAFTKEFLIRNDIPTAKYEQHTDIDEAKEALSRFSYPMVIKADGLAAGKGVLIIEDEMQGIKALDQIMGERVFKDAGSKVVMEEFLDGQETSILAFVDLNSIVPMESAKDYKRALDGDKGLNTGGMGNYSPSVFYDDEMEDKIRKRILLPTLEGFKKENMDYRGVIFIGIMIVNNEPYVLEYNVRFGDPETQVVLPRLETDIIDIIESILEDRLGQMEISWSDKKSLCVILASGGYPLDYEKGKAIRGLEDLDEGIYVYHSGTRKVDGDTLTNGGRVLGVTSLCDDMESLRQKIYSNIEKIDFEGKTYRNDIGL